MPGSAEVRSLNIGGDLDTKERLEGELHSSFENAVNYLFRTPKGTRMLTFLNEGMPLLPDSIVVSEKFFSRIRIPENYDIIKKDCHIRVGKLEVVLAGQLACNLHIWEKKKAAGYVCVMDLPGKKQQLEKYLEREEGETRSDLYRLPARYRKAMTELAEAFYYGRKKEALYWFERVAGAGRGLTPACDDAVIGMLAVMGVFLAGLREEGGNRYWNIAGEIEALLDRKELTTQVSRKYMQCACQGRFAQPLCLLVEWIMGGEREIPAEVVGQILKTGHTSGRDMLYGVMTALERLPE